jgi:hypothetical protein
MRDGAEKGPGYRFAHPGDACSFEICEWLGKG